MTRIYLDCDGVLADFNAGFERRFGTDPEYYEKQYGSTDFWKKIRLSGDFYTNLPVMPDAIQLFNEVEHLRPIILTGCPFGGWAETQKFKWRDKHFPGVPMVTCLSRHKRDYCKPGDILIDDMLKYKHLWEQAGGIFIEHKNSNESIDELKRLHVL